MKKLLKTIFITLLFTQLLEADQKKEPAPPLHTAVFDFTEGSDKFKGQGESVGKLLSAYLSTKENIYLVERAEIEKLLSEQELSLSGKVDSASAIKIGMITGARIIITGRVFGAGKKNYLVAKIISTETSRVFAATVNYQTEEKFDEAISALADKAAEVITKKNADLRAKVESFEQLITRLAENLPETKGTVYVNVPEEHLGSPVPDPACQTEIQKILKACGFTLAEKETDADYSITGEAFSQFAGRKGNLVACRARAELVIKKTIKTGIEDGAVRQTEMLEPDRTTVGDVGLAEAVVGKSALQKAGKQLAENFIKQIKTAQ